MRNESNINLIGREIKHTGKWFRAAQLAALAVAATVATPASALVINPTYDANVDTLFGANATNFKNAFSYAASQLTSNFSDNVHVNINVSGAAGTSILGQTSQGIFRMGTGSSSYDAIRNAAVADAKTADDATSIGAGGSVAATDPAGGNANWWMTRSQLKALSLISDDASSDGIITLGAGFNYAYDPNNRAVAGAFDIIGVMMHEISEIMGRIGLSGVTVGGATGYTLYDDFSYKSAGVRGLGSDSGNFFSIDGGVTLLKAFNGVSGGDSRDWASGTNDTFNAFSSSGVRNDLTVVDLRSVDIVGWDRIIATTSVPEPGALALLGIAMAGLAWRRRGNGVNSMQPNEIRF